ncbi:hypothetical protein U1Q18_031726 [Sarracenia purpurea var. burkii]
MFEVEIDSFKKLVQESWYQDTRARKMGYILFAKLKSLKARIKVWNAEVFGNVDSTIKRAMEELNRLDLLEGDDIIHDDQKKVKRELKANL